MPTIMVYTFGAQVPTIMVYTFGAHVPTIMVYTFGAYVPTIMVYTFGAQVPTIMVNPKPLMPPNPNWSLWDSRGLQPRQEKYIYWAGARGFSSLRCSEGLGYCLGFIGFWGFFGVWGL